MNELEVAIKNNEIVQNAIGNALLKTQSISKGLSILNNTINTINKTFNIPSLQTACDLRDTLEFAWRPILDKALDGIATSIALINIYNAVQETIKPVQINENDTLREELDDVLTEVIDNDIFDEDTQNFLRNIQSENKTKKLSMKKILGFVVSIITILDFARGCAPDKQLTQMTIIQQQQLETSQLNNELEAEQNRLIAEQNELLREQNEKITELSDKFVSLLGQLNEGITQVDSVIEQ